MRTSPRRRGPSAWSIPIAVDTDYAIWSAFANHFWPALYIADHEGRIRFHHFGEGEYPMTEMVIQQLLFAGRDGADHDLVAVEPHGLEVAADWQTLASPETYVGYRQSTGFAQEDSRSLDKPNVYTVAESAAPQRVGTLGHLDGRGPRRDLERARGRNRLQVPSARCQPRDGTFFPRGVDPIPGVPRRSARNPRTRH